MGNDEAIRDTGMPGMAPAKLKGAENDGEMPRSSRALFCFCFVEGAAAIKYLQRL